MAVPDFPRQNNLEWLRLVFAAQVVLAHTAEHVGLALPWIVGHFPGVPAFFFVSGFLIYSSYLNAPGQRYFENRFLRLFPGLLLVTMGGAGVALVAHGWRDALENFQTYASWIAAQVALGQAYNPALFRDVGVGVMNGALWTITTEILFYVSVPAIVWLEARFRFTVPALMCISFAAYVIGPGIWNEKVYQDKSLYDIVALTPVAWGWMFGFGILAAKHFPLVRRGLRHFPWAAVPMLAMIQFGSGSLFGSEGNRLGVVYFSCYVAIVLWLSFATPYVRLTFDLSYGSYIWHLPVINLLLVLGIHSAGLSILLTFAMAALSWLCVEKPALRLKRSSLKPVDGPPGAMPARP